MTAIITILALLAASALIGVGLACIPSHYRYNSQKGSYRETAR